MNWRNLVEKLDAESNKMLIPSIRWDDALALYTLTLLYALKHENVTVLDAGAGIGYSTIWLVGGLEEACRSKYRVYAIEYRRERYEKLREYMSILDTRCTIVEPVYGDAVEYMEKLPRNSIDIAFIDIDKSSYPDAFRVLHDKVRPGGIIAYHNLYLARYYLEEIANEAKRTG